MGKQIIKQPNGKFAVWSTITDDFDLLNCTPEEIIQDWIEWKSLEIRELVEEKVAKLEAGEKPYYQFTMTWEEALDFMVEAHGPKKKQVAENIKKAYQKEESPCQDERPA